MFLSSQYFLRAAPQAPVFATNPTRVPYPHFEAHKKRRVNAPNHISTAPCFFLSHLGGVGEPLLLLLQELAEVRADGGVNEHRLVKVGVTLRRRLEGRDQPHRRVFEQTLERNIHTTVFVQRAENTRRVTLQ